MPRASCPSKPWRPRARGRCSMRFRRLGFPRSAAVAEARRDRILNVDDYLPARYARTEVLRRAGFEVAEASTGAEALRLVVEERPDLVLLDVNLPDLDGFEVCRRIREQLGTLTLDRKSVV